METKIIVLDNKKKYAVINKLNYQKHLYLQIIEIDGDDDFLLVEKVGNDLFLIKDENVIKFVFNEMIKNLEKTNKKDNK